MNPTDTSLPAQGLIDIHSHLLPGIDDGCADMEESLACIRSLMAAGFIGSICTPHVATDMFPGNTPTHLQAHFDSFVRDLRAQGITYRLWLGCELRLSKRSIDQIQQHGVLPLAGTNRVLTDMWDPTWHKWCKPIYEWMIKQGYQPILAHPERLSNSSEMDKAFRELESMGVWLQGNYRSLTGEDGYHADRTVRKILTENRYKLMALDMHGPDSLAGRFDGMSLMEAEFGADAITRLTVDAPRRLIFSSPART